MTQKPTTKSHSSRILRGAGAASEVKVTWKRRDWIVDGDRLLIRPDLATGFVSDPHFGKEVSFQSSGIPVPGLGLERDLERLGAAVVRHGLERLVFLGDFLHDRQSQLPEVLERLLAWRRQHSDLEILLVRGNHDLRAGDPDGQLGIGVVDGPWHEDDLILVHDERGELAGVDPEVMSSGTVLSGHLHPAVLMKDRAGRSLRLACAWFSARSGILLPAFGSFTGCHVVLPKAGDRVVAVEGGSAVELPVG
jgi:DNA ligase-associated metallophosphoesterase